MASVSAQIDSHFLTDCKAFVEKYVDVQVFVRHLYRPTHTSDHLMDRQVVNKLVTNIV